MTKLIKIKKIIIIPVIFMLAFFLNSCTKPYRRQDPSNIPNVIIITLSGVRNSESIFDPTHQYISHLWNEMLPQGVLYTKLLSRDHEFHMPAVNAINTGKNFRFYFDINSPTIFQYIRKKYAFPRDKLWLIRHFKEHNSFYKTRDYAEETYPAELALDLNAPPELEALYANDDLVFMQKMKEVRQKFPGFGSYFWDSIEENVYRIFKKIMHAFKPKVVHYVMGAPETAHYDNFGRYVLSLKRSDDIIFEIWQMIKSDPSYKDNTYLIVCPDHSRDPYHMQHDENAHDNPSSVWLYVYGPNIKKGAVINRPIQHIDIFATVAYIMDVKTQSTNGKVLEDCFVRLRQELPHGQ